MFFNELLKKEIASEIQVDTLDCVTSELLVKLHVIRMYVYFGYYKGVTIFVVNVMLKFQIGLSLIESYSLG